TQPAFLVRGPVRRERLIPNRNTNPVGGHCPPREECVMSLSFCAWNHREWNAYGLADYGDFAECVTDCNQQEWNDHTTGEWWYIPDEPHTVTDQGTFRVIYRGTWGNDNSPGASSYTHADLFDVNDADDMAEFEAERARWESAPEWLDSEEDADEPEEGDYTS